MEAEGIQKHLSPNNPSPGGEGGGSLLGCQASALTSPAIPQLQIFPSSICLLLSPPESHCRQASPKPLFTKL